MKTLTKSKALIIVLLGLFAFQFVACDKSAYDERRKFKGTYNVEEYSYTGNRTATYESRIGILEFSDDEITISNFYGVGIEVTGVVLGSKIFIPDQTIGYFEIFGGQGALNNNVIEMDYSVKVSLPGSLPYTDLLEATFFKKY
jgi:hypothetical protein